MLTCYAAPRTFGNVIDKRKAEVAAYAVAAFVVVLLAMRLLHRDAGGSSGQRLSTTARISWEMTSTRQRRGQCCRKQDRARVAGK